MKWKLPVVSKDWVQACFRVPEKNFLMGVSKNFTEGKPEPSELEKEGKERGWDGKVLFLLNFFLPLLFKSTLPPLPAPSLPRPRPLTRIALPWTTAFSSLFSYTSCHYLLFTSSWILLQYSICISTSSSVFIASLCVPWHFRQLCHGFGTAMRKAMPFLLFLNFEHKPIKGRYYKLRGAREVWCESKRLIYSKKLLFTLHLLSFDRAYCEQATLSEGVVMSVKASDVSIEAFSYTTTPKLRIDNRFCKCLWTWGVVRTLMYLKNDIKKVYYIELLQSTWTYPSLDCSRSLSFGSGC